jgi:GMP synthase (glutamine-hydrolysing)
LRTYRSWSTAGRPASDRADAEPARRALKVLVLQHIGCEPPGEFEEVLKARRASLHRVELDEHEVLPDWRQFDAIVAMGGPMSVNDEDAFPWLAAEKQLIRDAVRSGTPFWGTCLGVQLLAASLGARVYPGPKPEVGLLPVTLTDEAMADPVFHGLARQFLALQWHGDTFDLPDGAVLLASSPAYPAQAFRWGRSAYGVQFHLEVSVQMATEWSMVPEYKESLERVLGPSAMEGLVNDLRAQSDGMLATARLMFDQWLRVTVDNRESSINSGQRL